MELGGGDEGANGAKKGTSVIRVTIKPTLNNTKEFPDKCSSYHELEKSILECGILNKNFPYVS